MTVSAAPTAWRRKKERLILCDQVETCYARTGSIAAVMATMGLSYSEVRFLLSRMRKAVEQ